MLCCAMPHYVVVCYTTLCCKTKPCHAVLCTSNLCCAQRAEGSIERGTYQNIVVICGQVKKQTKCKQELYNMLHTDWNGVSATAAAAQTAVGL